MKLLYKEIGPVPLCLTVRCLKLRAHDDVKCNENGITVRALLVYAHTSAISRSSRRTRDVCSSLLHCGLALNNSWGGTAAVHTSFTWKGCGEEEGLGGYSRHYYITLIVLLVKLQMLHNLTHQKTKRSSMKSVSRISLHVLLYHKQLLCHSQLACARLFPLCGEKLSLG